MGVKTGFGTKNWFGMKTGFGATTSFWMTTIVEDVVDKGFAINVLRVAIAGAWVGAKAGDGCAIPI